LINSILVLTHVVFIYCFYHLHFFIIPTRLEMLSKLSEQVKLFYEEKIVFVGASLFYQAFDFINAWWFVVLPAILLLLKIALELLKKRSEETARGFMQLLISFLALILFFSLSLQILTVIMLAPNFYR